MKIVGGIYREICLDPRSDVLYGSGLRAVISISKGCDELSLIGLGEQKLEPKIRFISQRYNFKVDIFERQKEIGFIYDTPISSPRIYGINENYIDLIPTIEVSGTNVLAFAMVDSNIKIQADYLVIDPQGLSIIEGKIKWDADHLAIVANRREVIGMLGTTEDLGLEVLAEKMRVKYNADVSVIKCGPLGAIVSNLGKIYHINAYYTNKVNPIGSGDVFSAVFAYFWAEMRTTPEIAAKNASKATAEWVLNGPFQVIGHKKSVTAPNAEEEVYGEVSTVYLAAPFFTVSERWMVDLCRNALKELGGTVFSPLHEVGMGNTEGIVFHDIEGLAGSNSVLALLDGMDPGTLFEVGYASALKKQIIVYVGNTHNDNLTMIRANNAHIHDDLASAIYDAIWLGINK